MCLQIISVSLLGLTLVAIIWYAWETRKLRMETVKQTELSLRPYVILNQTYVDRIDFENIGLSHALDVRIDDLETPLFRVLFEPCCLVRHGQSVNVKFHLEGKDQETKEILKASRSTLGFPFFKYYEPAKDYSLMIQYNNIEGISYYTLLEVKLKENRIEVIRSEKN